MSAVDDARDALNATRYGVNARTLVQTRNALKALIAEHELLTTPPTDDDREALSQVYYAARYPEGMWVNGYRECPEADDDTVFDAILAAGFRRRALTHEMVDAAAQSLAGLSDQLWMENRTEPHVAYYIDAARAALEAALATEQQNRCSKCGATVTDQTPTAFYGHHDEVCGGLLEEPTGEEQR